MAVDPVIFRTPMLSPNGQLTREWIRFFQQLSGTTGATQNTLNVTTLTGEASAFDDVTVPDATFEINDAILAAMGNTPACQDEDAAQSLQIHISGMEPVDDLAGLFLPGDTSVLGALQGAVNASTPIYYSTGLPLTSTFTVSSNNALILIAGSCFAVTTAGIIGFSVLVDGTVMGSAVMYAATVGVHTSIPTMPILMNNLTAGSHTIRLQARDANTSADGNDFFTVTVIGLP